MTSQVVRVAAASVEAADHLVETIRRHGLACEPTRRSGRVVEIRWLDGDDDGPVRAALRAADLWLLLRAAPDASEVRPARSEEERSLSPAA